jgi:hypothetical protein
VHQEGPAALTQLLAQHARAAAAEHGVHARQRLGGGLDLRGGGGERGEVWRRDVKGELGARYSSCRAPEAWATQGARRGPTPRSGPAGGTPKAPAAPEPHLAQEQRLCEPRVRLHQRRAARARDRRHDLPAERAVDLLLQVEARGALGG